MLNSRLRLVLMLAVVLYFIIILLLLKKRELNLKYSLLWLLSGLLMGGLIIFPEFLLVVVHLVGIQTPMYGLLLACTVFIIAILMSLTSIVSRQNRKIRVLIQTNALLEYRIRKLEKILFCDEQIEQNTDDNTNCEDKYEKIRTIENLFEDDTKSEL